MLAPPTYGFGGLIGVMDASSTVEITIEQCFNRGAITVSAGTSVGGLVGINHADIHSCYNAGAVTGSENVGGGLIGRSAGGDVPPPDAGAVALTEGSKTEYLGTMIGRLSGSLGFEGDHLLSTPIIGGISSSSLEYINKNKLIQSHRPDHAPPAPPRGRTLKTRMSSTPAKRPP